jgi:putative transposase
MKRWCKVFAISLMCRVLEVSRSGYYDWLTRRPSARALEDERLKVEIRAAHQRSRETYGPRRLQPELAATGVRVGRDRIDRLRRSMGLCCRQRRRFKSTTNSRHTLPVAPNLLNQDFRATARNQIWVSDLTYISTGEGWLYLAGIKDVFTCEIVGYAMGERMLPELTGRALFRAVQQHRPAPGIIHHSDRGSQYCAEEYQAILKQFGFQISMSRKGNCFDNAPMQSFWGSLKTEMVHHRNFATRADAESAIREYIEVFYNRQSIPDSDMTRLLCSRTTSDRLKFLQAAVSVRSRTPQSSPSEPITVVRPPPA